MCSQGIGKLVDELVIIFIAAATYFFAKVYIFLWNRTKLLATTPSGFGVLLPLFMLISMVVFSQNASVSFVSILIVFISGHDNQLYIYEIYFKYKNNQI